MRSPLFFAVLVSWAASATAQTGPSEGSEAAPDLPANTLIVIADDLGVDCVGAYDEADTAPNTPNIDRLAEGGMLFRNAWTAPMCSPSRASIQTGRLPFRNGVGFVLADNAEGLADSEVTLPELLAQHTSYDFVSALFGKWHLGGGTMGPLDQGYRHYSGYPNNLYEPQSYFDYTRYDNGTAVQSTTYATTDTVDQALAWIQTAQEPWLCVVSFHAPHEPFHAPPDELHSVDLTGAHPRTNPRPLYEAMVEAMDTEFGRLMAEMGPAFRRTNIYFMGDNGTPKAASLPPFIPQHAKLTPYEGGINVPLIVHGPDVRTSGTECHGLVNLTDVFATVADYSGVESTVIADPAHPLDSISLRPYLDMPDAASLRERTYAGAFNPSDVPNVNLFTWHMVRDGRYKFIVVDDAGTMHLEMYDLEVDPFEQNNIAHNDLNTQERNALKGAIHELRALINGG